MVPMEKLMSWLGRPSSNADVQAFFVEQGLPKVPKIARGESDVYLNLEAHGLSLLFEEADYFAKQHRLELPTDAPVLSAVFLYGPGDDEYQAFQGNLFKGLRFDMGQKQAQQLLGPAALLDDEFNTEAWDIGDHIRLFVDYDDERRQAIRIVQASYFSPDE